MKKGDVLIEFDGVTVNRTLDEKKSEVRGFEAQIEQSRSESQAAEQKSVTAEMTAGYDVDRAKLDYSAKDILSRVEGEQRGLKVNDNEEKLREASAKLSSDRVGGKAKVAGVAGKRAKSEFDLNKAERQLQRPQRHGPCRRRGRHSAQLALGQLDEPAGLQGRRPRVGRRQHRRAAGRVVDVRLGARGRSGARASGARTSRPPSASRPCPTRS